MALQNLNGLIPATLEIRIVTAQLHCREQFGQLQLKSVHGSPRFPSALESTSLRETSAEVQGHATHSFDIPIFAGAQDFLENARA